MAKKTYRLIVLGSAMALGFAFTGPLAAHDRNDKSAGVNTSKRMTTSMSHADRDRNGRVTREEAMVDQTLSGNFRRHDRNGDGELDSAEFAQLEASVRSHSSRGYSGDEMYSDDFSDDSDTELRPRHVVHPTPSRR